MGDPTDNERQLVPEAVPTIMPPEIDWDAAFVSYESRPELLAQQAAIRSAATQLKVARNGVRPDVLLTGDYAITGLDDRYDQSIGTVFDNQFNDWSVGLLYSVPLGQRTAYAAVRRAEFALSRETARLRELEYDIEHELYNAKRDFETNYEVLSIHQRRRKAAALHLQARAELFEKANATLEEVINAQSRYTAALLSENGALINYQKSRVHWRFANGTLLGDDVVVDE